MEQTSDLVQEGKLIHEDSYPQRSEKYEEVEIEGIKVDYYDKKNKIIHEIKKTDKIEPAHEWQLKYYLYVFEQNGINGVSGILEYPKLRKTQIVNLNEDDKYKIENIKKDIENIMKSEVCPTIEKKPRCKNCSFYDFCFVNENEI
jgi:CRISPR-associated exonuclease Cas4